MNFWDVHGWWFLIGIATFPRLTMLFVVPVPFGWLAWVGWAVWPSLLVAILATSAYWHANPWLCVVAWFLVVGKFVGSGGAASSKRTSLRR